MGDGCDDRPENYEMIFEQKMDLLAFNFSLISFL